MRRFASIEEAQAVLGPLLDRRAAARTVEISPGLTLMVGAVELGSGRFCNVYTARWRAPARARVVVMAERLESPYARATALARAGRRGVVATGGFMFLADEASARPRAWSLNLAVRAGRVVSAPVVGQDALIAVDGELVVRAVAARGLLRLNGEVLRWVGSRAGGAADCVVFGNANACIVHRADERTGKRRCLIEATRWTPAAAAGEVDVGLMCEADGRFRGVEVKDGGIDVFAFDLVLRCARGRVRAPVSENVVEVLEIDGVDPRTVEGACSVGPSVLDADLEGHALHAEPSLGSTPLLGGQRAARLLYFRDSAGSRFLQLWDGRPGSGVCPGVTLDEVAAAVRREHDVVEGCFLDSGRSGKLCVSDGAAVESLGNRHYLRWPGAGEQGFVWTPDAGRPLASLVVVG